MLEQINGVKFWIRLNIPKIEDGNNFGVGVQEEIVSFLAKAEDSAITIMETISNYFLRRAQLVAKMLKHPNIEDFQYSVTSLDDKEFVNLRVLSLDLKNEHTILHDLILKNMDKLLSPRSSHMSHMMH